MDETNRFADQELNNPDCKLSMKSELRKWEPTHLREIKAFIAVQILMGLSVLPEESDHWATDPLFETPGFGKILPRRRYLQLKHFLHFNDNSKARKHNEPGFDPIYKIRPVVDYLTNKFTGIYQPGRETSIDESMIGFRGRWSSIQYIPSKYTRFGMKAWAECEPKTSYTRHWSLYTGKDPNDNDTTTPAGTKVVRKLTSDIHNLGHHLYIDNFYTSVQLAQELKSNGIGVCGTMRTNRKEFPGPLKPSNLKLSKKNPGPVFVQKGNLLCIGWYDKKAVYLLTTVHEAGSLEKQVRTKDSDTGYRVVTQTYC